MRKEFPAIFLTLILLLSGCVLPFQNVWPFQNQLPTYKDDVITIENYALSSSEIYAGSSVTIQFLVQSNAEKEIKGVEVDFFDISAFQNLALDCGPGAKKKGNKCVFDLNSLDYQPIKITLKAPNESVITAPTKFPISFKISYNMSSERSVMIPVVDGVIKTEPQSSFLVSEQLHGPVRVDFDFPIKRVRKEDDREIVERWVVAGEPFEVKITFDHTGSLENVRPIEILNGSIKIKVKELTPLQPCDFYIPTYQTETKMILFKDITLLTPRERNVLQTETEMTSLKNITLLTPRERNVLKCNFNATKKDYPEYLAELTIFYNYTYSFIKNEIITVKPPLF